MTLGRRDAPIASQPKRKPLILLSPGSGGDANQVSWWGGSLAAAGYIVVAFNHNGTEAEELGRVRPTLTDFFGCERAADVSYALSQLTEDPELGQHIDPDRIGAAGFSLGGTTALWLAGAQLDLEKLRRDSPPPPPQLANAIQSLVAHAEIDPIARGSVARAERSYRDERIKAVFVLAPPMGAGFPEGKLRRVKVPVGIVVGDTDLIAPQAENARHFATAIPGARFTLLPGERGHYTSAVDRETQQRELLEVAKHSIEFFAVHLRAEHGLEHTQPDAVEPPAGHQGRP